MGIERIKDISEEGIEFIRDQYMLSKHLPKSMVIDEVLRRVKFYEEEQDVLGINILNTIIDTFIPPKLDVINHFQLILAQRLKVTEETFVSIYARKFRELIERGITCIDVIEDKLRKENL